MNVQTRWNYHHFKSQTSEISRPIHIPRQQYLIYWQWYQHTNNKDVYSYYELLNLWESDLSEKIKRDILQAETVSILLYRSTTWMEKNLHGNYTRMPHAGLNKYIYIYIYIYKCVCVRVCACVKCKATSQVWCNGRLTWILAYFLKLETPQFLYIVHDATSDFRYIYIYIYIYIYNHSMGEGIFPEYNWNGWIPESRCLKIPQSRCLKIR